MSALPQATQVHEQADHSFALDTTNRSLTLLHRPSFPCGKNAAKRTCTNYPMKVLCAKRCLKAQSSLWHNFSKANWRYSLPTSHDFAKDGYRQWVPPCSVVLKSSVSVPTPARSVGTITEPSLCVFRARQSSHSSSVHWLLY